MPGGLREKGPGLSALPSRRPPMMTKIDGPDLAIPLKLAPQVRSIHHGFEVSVDLESKVSAEHAEHPCKANPAQALGVKYWNRP